MFAARKSKYRVHFIVLFLALLCAGVLAYMWSAPPLLPPIDPKYQDASLGTNERIEDLLSHMTLEEKVGQMALVEKNSVLDLLDMAKYGIGAVLSGSGGKPENNTAVGWREMVGMFVEASRASRLQIPALYGVDAIHGHSNVPGATVFPHFIGLGASHDESLVERVARATRDELLATGVRWSYSPTLDLPQDIRWGRTYEAFGDDPARAGLLGAAYIRGLQGSDESGEPIEVLATAKHYVGNGSMVWDTSSSEDFKIDQGTTVADNERLRSTYLPPFEDAIDAGAMSVMVGLNSWGDTKLSAHHYLINDVLKGELDFAGFVVSDWYGVYEIPGGEYRAAVTAINAGVDMVMLPFDYKAFIKNVTRAVRSGEIDEARIDDAVRRILRAKFALGLFENDNAAPIELFGSPEHKALAREAVQKSLVLLKNNGALPITQSATHIRVAGSAADNAGRQMGAWTVEWQGVDGNWLPGVTSILSGIREVASIGTTIEYDIEGNFLQEASRADIGIAIVGESPYAEGWGDNPNPALSAADRAVIERLKETSDQVVVVLVTGRPLFITDWIGDVDALVVAWLPGSEGAGVADALFGERSFTGTLPLAWPQNVTQLPIAPDGTTADGTTPLFVRAYGL